MKNVTVVKIKMSKQDFQLLTISSCAWDSSLDKDARFETLDNEETQIRTDLKKAYWLEDSRTALILARSYLESVGADYQILTDMEGEKMPFVILTNY